MSILLDTNAFIMMFAEPERLPKNVRERIEIEEAFISIVTPWEMTIKESLGKLRLTTPSLHIVREHLERKTLLLLSLEVRHFDSLLLLPHYHRDPFDRIIIAQAITENLPVVSSDAAFDDYGVKRIW